jgi:general secretion pathway protein K
MRENNERGVALLLALLVLALLVALILEFDAEARRELREAAAFRDGLKATLLGRAAVQAARAILQHDTRLERQQGSAYDGLKDVWATPITNYQLGDGTISAGMTDERGKLNLNDLANLSDAKVRQTRILKLQRLFDLIQVDPRLVQAIADWVDADEAAEPNGAESSYYQTLRPPYRAANGPMQTISDLYLIKGFTEETIQRVMPYVTVYPSTGDGWINLNTADPLVLQSLDPRMTTALAQSIVQARPFRTIQDADRVSGFEPLAKELRLTSAYQIRSDYFSVRISVRVQDVTKIAKAVLRRFGTEGESEVVYFRIE